MIDASLNEVEALAAKAARGAGLSWGLCEDTGKAARWLAARGIDWAPSLAALLTACDKLAGPFDSSIERQVSPLLTGSFFADLGTSELEISHVAHPAWLLPFAARVAALHGRAVCVGWAGASVVVSSNGCELAGSTNDLMAPYVDIVTWSPFLLSSDESRRAVALPNRTRCSISVAAWQALEVLGARTYVPASNQSRTRGAGAGLTDND
jgi:Protein of unknown function (DUF3726)